ncbi:aminodeoxychorismate synthase component I [Candidatus Kuenenia sp.]|uniref:aminodeoxychorismate synthase component I n=1 Tax=Candidatus Kuenenia sp. TaxID=2499824 RepID=UPI00321FA788
MKLDTCVTGKVTAFEMKEACAPLEAFCRFLKNPNVFFLDSALPNGEISRYSFLGFSPFLTIKTKHNKIRIKDKDGSQECEGNPFEYLRKILNRFSLENTSDSLPFQGGAVGYFGYDLCHYIEKLPNNAVDDLELPDIYMGFYDIIISYDNLLEKCFVVGVDFGMDNTLNDRIGQITEILCGKSEESGGMFNDRDTDRAVDTELRSNFTKDAYMKAIRQIKKYISAGDVYQVNLSQRIEAHIDMPAYELYKRLRKINPAPFACYLGFDDVSIISSSPERFLRVSNRQVQTRPIKGTRPRGKNALEDEEMKQALLSSQKDNAELTMITDLERNDLGRVCNYGSIKVIEEKALETYPTVHHLVSTVIGELHERYDIIDLLRATFPGGSITGAPKIRAMQIIDDLEPCQRSVYTGSIGYIGFNGNLDLNIAIRTFIMKGETVYFQVGSGIVADSDAEDEYEETLHKAKALIESLNPCLTLSS